MIIPPISFWLHQRVVPLPLGRTTTAPAGAGRQLRPSQFDWYLPSFDRRAPPSIASDSFQKLAQFWLAWLHRRRPGKLIELDELGGDLIGRQLFAQIAAQFHFRNRLAG